MTQRSREPMTFAYCRTRYERTIIMALLRG
jgi:hypothetical protein